MTKRRKNASGAGRQAVLLLCAGALAAGLAACDDDALVDEKYTLQLYYANEAYIESGDESAGHLTEPVKQALSRVQGADEDEQYEVLLENLREVPEKAQEGAVTMVTDDIHFGAVSVENGVALVDVLTDGAALTGGTLEEILLIEQITFSLIDSFDEVRQVQFLVDGNVAETLMGQMDISEPFDEGSFGGNER
jgi:spore germination protein GerM